MTISTQVAKSPLYNCNGVTTAFSTTFPFQNNSDLGVYRLQVSTGTQVKLVLNTNYTVTGAGSPSGGTVTISPALSSDYKIRILREAPYTQATDYVEGTSFPADTHERALDKATMLIQQVKESVERSPQLPITSSAYPLTFPDGGSSNGNKVIQWNAGGTALTNTSPGDLDLSLTGGDAITVSGHYTINLDINKQTSLSNIDPLNDYMLIRDATDGQIKRARPADMLNTGLLSGQGITVTNNIINQDIMKQAITAVDRAADYVLFYDSSAGGYKKSLISGFSISSISQDTNPTLGGNLDFNGFSGTTVGNNIRFKATTTGDINLEPGAAGVVNIVPLSGTPTLNIGSGAGTIMPIKTNSTSAYYIGEQSGDTATSTFNVGIGYQTLTSATGSSNVALGPYCGRTLTSGYLNVMLGNAVGYSLTTGQNNLGIGATALYTATSGYSNVAIGSNGGRLLTTGSANVLIGVNSGFAGTALSTGSSNVLIGPLSQSSNSTTSQAIAIGDQVIADPATGSTSANHGPCIALGSTASGNGFRGDKTPYPTSGSAAGFVRIKLNGTYYKIPIMADV